MYNPTLPLELSDGKETPITKLVIAHQILNCIKCPLVSRCSFTRDLSNMAAEGKVDVDAIETLSACGSANLKTVVSIIRRSGNGKEFINKLLNLLIKEGVRSRLRVELFKEGSIIVMDGFSLVLDNAKSLNGQFNISLPNLMVRIVNV